MSTVRKATQWALIAACMVCGALIAWRALAGPIDSPIHLNSPLNVESVFGLCAVLLMLLSACADAQPDARAWGRMDVVALLAIAGIAVAAYWRAFGFYFLSDDFIQLKYALAPMYHVFTMGGGDGFYRPLANASLGLTGSVAGANPVAWHAIAIAIHAVNASLMYCLASMLRLSRCGAWFAAALFAVHASHPEAVVWISARYDLLATCFSLLCLIFFLRAWDARVALNGMLALVAMILAFLSKESAYALPILLVLLVVWKDEWRNRRSYFALLPFFAASLAILAWRWILFGGIGGYRAPSGEPEVLALGVISTVKALTLRLWAVLFFPVNWSYQPGMWLALALVLFVAALLWSARAPRSWRGIAFAIGFVLIAALPPVGQLLIGRDLLKARVLYLPSVGFCLLLAFLVERVRARWIVSGAILLFQLVALFHNLAAWDYASRKARPACEVAASCLKSRGGNVSVFGLPVAIRGAYFFANGFRECVDMELSGQHANVELNRGATHDPAQSSCVLDWDEKTDELRVR